MKTFIIILLTAVVAVAGTLFLQNHFETTSRPTTTADEHKQHHYQCAMHPQVKSDKPGRCTICGMELTPIYEGNQVFDQTGGESVVPLTPNQIKILNVQTEAARIQPLTKTLRVAGTIDDDQHRHRIISAYVDGRVDKLYTNHVGAEVVAGQPLALIYSPNLLQAEREYRQLSGELRKNTGVRLKQMGLTAEQIADLPNKDPNSLQSEILAPMSGTVVAHDIYEGQYFTAGQKLMEIADFSTMWFMFPAYEQDMPWIEIGQTVVVTTPSKPGVSFTGKVTFIDPNFDETTRSTKVRVELPNPLINGQRQLLHRLYADAALEMKIPPLLTIPRSALIQTGAEPVVYVDRGHGSYAQTVVKSGRRGDSAVEVLSGISEGDLVVTQGNLLIDGQAELDHTVMAPAGNDLTEAQQKAVADFTKMADAMSAALAADDLAAFNKASEPAMAKTAEFTAALSGREGLEALNNARHFHGLDNLAKARQAFYRFSMAAAAVLAPLPSKLDFQIWECPMVNEAVPGAEKKGRWIQTGGRPIGNPYFGKAMLTCGEQVKR